MGKISPWVQRRQNREEDARALEEFLKNGGKVVKLKSGEDSRYDENLKKTEKVLLGGFNPFSKEDSLREE